MIHITTLIFLRMTNLSERNQVSKSSYYIEKNPKYPVGTERRLVVAWH
jgi:hypothetical protein